MESLRADRSTSRHDSPRLTSAQLFHYRNHGGDLGKILAGIQVPREDYAAFDDFLSQLGYTYVEETDNVVYRSFLGSAS